MKGEEAMLSVIIPAYNEEAMVPLAAETIRRVLTEAEIPHELLFVDDGSGDGTWACIQAAAEATPAVRGVRFSRNFGKESAIFAGLYHAKGACCAVIDCDLQHPPEKLVEMYRLWQQGYEIVECVKRSRGQESAMHGLAAGAFYRLISRAAGFDMRRASDYKLLDRSAVNALLNIREKNTFFRALSTWVGFKSVQIEFDVRERVAGESKWSLWSLTRYAVKNITSFTSAPMYYVAALGAVMFIVTLIFGGIALAQKLRGVAQEGFTTVILLLLFIGSIVMISLGIIGYYLSVIFDEIKGRPRYIVAEQCGDMDPESERTAK